MHAWNILHTRLIVLCAMCTRVAQYTRAMGMCDTHAQYARALMICARVHVRDALLVYVPCETCRAAENHE